MPCCSIKRPNIVGRTDFCAKYAGGELSLNTNGYGLGVNWIWAPNCSPHHLHKLTPIRTLLWEVEGPIKRELLYLIVSATAAPKLPWLSKLECWVESWGKAATKNMCGTTTIESYNYIPSAGVEISGVVQIIIRLQRLMAGLVVIEREFEYQSGAGTPLGRPPLHSR